MNLVFNFAGRPGNTAGLPLPPELAEVPTRWATRLEGSLQSAPTSEDWWTLGQALAALPGVKVEFYGDSSGSDAGEEPSAIGGLRVNAGGDFVRLLPRSVLGDVPPELAHEMRLPSAASIAVKLVEGLMGAPDGLPKMKASIASSAISATYAGPMMVYRGGAQMAEGWDLTKAHLGAWEHRFPYLRTPKTWAGWQATDDEAELRGTSKGFGPIWHNATEGGWPGFAIADVYQESDIPAIPAAIGLGMGKLPMRGVSTVCASIFALDALQSAGALEVRKVRAICATPGRHFPFKEVWEGIGAYKAIYQRVFSGLNPAPRWIATLRRGELVWKEHLPDPRRSHPQLAVTGWWHTARKTASVLALLPAGAGLASHIDSAYINTSPWTFTHETGRQEEIAPFDLVDILNRSGGMGDEPGKWRIKVDSYDDVRFYAPGRWDVGKHKPRMGGEGSSPALRAELDQFMNTRVWSGNPKVDRYATSKPVDSRGRWEYDFLGRVIQGEHNEKGA